MTFEGCVLSAVFAGKNTNMITQSYLSDPPQILIFLRMLLTVLEYTFKEK